MENNECIGPVYRNDRICTECGGQCCKIYTSPDQGGSYPNDVWFEEYCEDFHMHADRYDVEPLFDPIITHMQGNEQMLVDLEQQGIDPYACQYLGSTGCRIRWDLRPLQCRVFACDRLRAPENVVAMVDRSRLRHH